MEVTLNWCLSHADSFSDLFSCLVGAMAERGTLKNTFAPHLLKAAICYNLENSLKSAWFRIRPRTTELETVPLSPPTHLWEYSVFQSVKLEILFISFILRRLALIFVKAALAQAVPKQPVDLQQTFYLLGLW